MLRLKNTTEQDFSFEGVKIPAGGISEPLTPEIHGRMLAIDGGRHRIENYIEQESKPIPKQEVQEAVQVSYESPVKEESQALQDFLKVPEKPVEKFTCEECGSEFDSSRALKGHKVGAKHN